MKIELNENKVFFNNGKSIQEIHSYFSLLQMDQQYQKLSLSYSHGQLR
mgnify:CR=1 FL=1